MIKNRGEIQSQYQSFSKKLTEKKEKNFNEKGFKDWDLSPFSIAQSYTKEMLLMNKKLAFQEMYPKEN